MRVLYCALLLSVTCLTASAQRFVKTFDSINALLAANPNDVHTNAYVTGRTTANDGSGGIYTWNSTSTTATNANLSILKANNFTTGRWFRDNGFVLTTFTTNRVAVIGYDHILTNGTVTITELNYLGGATNNIQTQINNLISSNTYPKIIRISYEGDSLVNQVLPTWPDYISSYSPYLASAFYVTNYGNSGDRVSAMNAQYATETHLNRPTAAYEEAWFFLHGGGNDLADGVAASTVYNYIKNEWEAARLDGYTKVVAFEISPRYDFSASLPLVEAQRIELNRLIRSDPTLYDYLVPAAIMPSPTSSNVYYYDGTHPTELGARTLARMAVNVIFGKAFEIVPASMVTVTNTTDGLILLPHSALGTVALGTTNTTAKLTVANSYTQPTAGLDTNTAFVLANNNVASGTVNASIISRSSGLARLYFGNDTLERNDFIEADFAGSGLGLAFGIFGSEKMHLDTTGLAIGTNTPSVPLESVGTSPQLKLRNSTDHGKTTTIGTDASGYAVLVPSGGSFQVTGNGMFTSYVYVGSGAPLIMGTNGVIYSLGTNQFSLFDASQTLPSDLHFGTSTTNRFMIYAGNSTNVDFKLGDNSYYTQIRPGYLALMYSGGSGHLLRQDAFAGTVTSGVLTLADMPANVVTNTGTSIVGEVPKYLTTNGNSIGPSGVIIVSSGPSISLPDVNGNYFSISPPDITTDINFIPPAAPFTGLGYYTASGTNWMLSQYGPTVISNAVNLGAGTVGPYASTSGSTLQFNSMVAGSGVTLSSNANVITIAASATGTTINSSDTYLPYRLNATTFNDSPFYVSDLTNAAINGQLLFYPGTNNAVNYERGMIQHASGAWVFDSQAGGTGTVRDHVFKFGGTTRATLSSTGSLTGSPASTNNYIFWGTGFYADASGQLELNANGGGPEVHFGPYDTTAPFYIGTATGKTVADTTAFFNLKNSGSTIVEVQGGGHIIASGNVSPAADNTKSSGLAANRWSNTYTAKVTYDAATSGLVDTFGSGTPEGSVTANVGSTYRRSNGGAGTSFYVKESGTGNTGWVSPASRTNYVTVALSNPNAAVTTGNTNFWIAPEAVTIKTVTAHLFVPSSSGSVTLELKKNGTTVLSAPVSLTSGTTNATASLSVTAVAEFDRLAGEITAAGTTAYGAQLKIGYTIP